MLWCIAFLCRPPENLSRPAHLYRTAHGQSTMGRQANPDQQLAQARSSGASVQGAPRPCPPPFAPKASGIGQALVAVLVLAGIGPVASPRLVAAPEASPETVPLRTTAARLEPAGCQVWLGNGDFECGMRCFNGVPVWSPTSPSVTSAVSG